MSERNTRTSSLKRKASLNLTFAAKRAKKTSCKKLISILQKNEEDRTPGEKQMILDSNDSISVLKERLKKINAVKSRNDELEDEPDLLEKKCKQLANAIQSAKHVVVYTGAGISTAAKIPDYRGTKGIWTLLQQGKDIGNHDLSLAEPTLTHMALYNLHRHGLIKHVVSQNCDDLHLRSGLPRSVLSEVHGNMSVEVCAHCEPVRYYWRVFDVTEHTGRYAHQTARKCSCGEPLLDTIIHFGEKGVLLWPLNWDGANNNADKADLILCVGSSLKVLRKYGWIWGLDKPKKERPKLYIINLQWTPKDDQATLKINGKCDAVFQRVMSHLNLKIPMYDKLRDPIFYHSSHLIQQEYHTVRKPMLEIPEKEYFRNYSDTDKLLDSFCKLENYQNTTVFVKEEDEIKVKEENFVDETESLTVKLELCEQKIKEEPNECKFLKRSKCNTDKASDVSNHQEYGDNSKNNPDEDLKLESQITTKHDSKLGMHTLRDCTVNLTDVMGDKQNLTEIKKYFRPSKVKHIENKKTSSSDECELKSLVQESTTSFSKGISKIGDPEKSVNTEHSLKYSDCFRNLAKTNDGSEEDLAGLDIETSGTLRKEKKYIQLSKSKSDQAENQTISEINVDNLKRTSKTLTTSNGTPINIKNTLKNFRRTKKCDKPSINSASSTVDSMQKSSVRLEETSFTSVNIESSPMIIENMNASLKDRKTVSNQSQISCSSNDITPLTPHKSLEKRFEDKIKRDEVTDANNDTSSSLQDSLSETSVPPISPKTSPLLNSSVTPTVVINASSFSTLVASSHSKCDCRCAMDLLGSSNGTCSCGTDRIVSKPIDGSVLTGGKLDKGNLPGGISQSSIVAIVKPLIKESDNKANSITNHCSISKDESIKESPQILNSITTNNINCDIDLQDSLNVNLLVANQVIGSNFKSSEPVIQPFMPPQMLSIFPNTNMVQSVPQPQQLLPQFQPLLQPQPILQQGHALQHLLPFLMNGNLLSPNNILTPPFSLAPPFITGMSNPLQTPLQILTPQMPFNPFPNQSPPLIYLQPLSMNSSSVPQQVSSSVLMCPPLPSVSNMPFTLPSTIPMQCPPSIQPMIQPNVSNISNISLSDTYNCVQSAFDNNVLSSRPILSQLPNLPLTIGQIPVSLAPLSQQSHGYAFNQQSSTHLPSNIWQPVNNVPIVDTGQNTPGAPVTSNTPTSDINVDSNTPVCHSLLSQPTKINGLKNPENSSTPNASPLKENNTSPTKSEVPNQHCLSYKSTKESLSPSSQTNLSPNQRNFSSGSPLKPPQTSPHCSPRIISPLRSPLTPLSSPITSPLRRIRTIRPFQFKNDTSIPDDLMYCQSEDRTPSDSDKINSSSKALVISERDTAFPAVLNSPSKCSETSNNVSQSTNIFPMSRPVSCQETNSDPTEENVCGEKQEVKEEEKPQETEVKKRGRKAKPNKEEKPAEVYHYSLPRHCEFCLHNYDSPVCLFYERQDVLTLTGRRKVYCNCCSSSKETEEATTSAVPTANPGWFGKGYRKNIKRKRSL